MENYQIFKINGDLIIEKECNSIKELLEFAIENGANLEGAFLEGANLIGASLDGAYLEGASLDGADLEGASLEGASLRGASLDGASLDGASLEGASLEGADLEGASLEGAKVPLFCKWSFGFVDHLIFVGCEQKTAKEWIKWLKSGECFETEREDPDFKRIRASIMAAIAYQEEMNK